MALEKENGHIINTSCPAAEAAFFLTALGFLAVQALWTNAACQNNAPQNCLFHWFSLLR